MRCGSAPDQLVRTVQGSLSAELGSSPGEASAFTQFAHLALPFAIGEQGPLNAAGLPAVLVQASGEHGPGSRNAISEQRLQNFGSAVLGAVNALDADSSGVGVPTAAIELKDKALPAWAVQVLVAALLLPSLVVTVDALARARRRKSPVAQALTWVLSCALPFFFCGLVAVALGAAGLLRAAPAAPAPAPDVPVGASEAGALVVLVLAFAIAWLARAALLRTLGTLPAADDEDGEAVGLAGSGAAGVALMLVLDLTAVVVWVIDPFAALLLVPAAHVWLVIASPELRARRLLSAGLLLVGVLPAVAIIALYSHQLGLSLPEAAWTAVLLVAGGHIGLVSSALWSLFLGCLVAAALLALRAGAVADGEATVSVRGPLSYAGPGSLGGTESALRR